MGTKQLWVLAGGNGAGKSTFYRTFLLKRGLPFVNADEIAKELEGDLGERNRKAALHAESLRYEMLEEGISFCFETVFSHPSKIDILAFAKARGYKITLVYIHLSSTELNEARVHQRVTEGGHHVAVEKIHSRIPRTLRYIAQALPLADEVRLLDNSSRKQPFQQVAMVKKGNVVPFVSPLPDWAKSILAGSPSSS